MSKYRRFLSGLMICLVSMLIGACKADVSGLETVTVSELASMLGEDESVVVCDANSADVRQEYGVIPGAVLLTSYGGYDVVAELPAGKDRSLVFYCSSQACSAAPRAARRALEAGFKEVYVMPEGIKGWVKAGQPVDKKPVG